MSGVHVTLVLWVVCVTVQQTAGSGTLGRSWCYTKHELPHTITCNQGDALTVVRAVPSVHTVNNHRFCQDPVPSPADCQLAEPEQTDHFRRMCNGRRTCVFLLVRRPRNTCLLAPGGAMYLHMEYTCVSGAHQGGKEYPIVRPSLSKHSVGVGPVVWVQSSAYPSLWDNLTHTPCTITTGPGVSVKVTVRDLTVAPSADVSCGYSVYVGNATRICARRGMAAYTVEVEPWQAEGRRPEAHLGQRSTADTQLELATGDGISRGVLGRYWVEISGFSEDGADPASVKVTCTNQLSPYAQSYTGDGGGSDARVWVPILLILLIIVAVIIIGIIIWRLRKQKKANISQTESDVEEEGRTCPPSVVCLSCLRRPKAANNSQTDAESGDRGNGSQPDGESTDKDKSESCCAYLCKPCTTDNSEHDSESNDNGRSCFIRLCKRQAGKAALEESEGVTKTDSCCVLLCKRKTMNDSQTNPENDDKSDLCHSLNGSLPESGGMGETCFSRLRKRLSRKKNAPPSEYDRKESAGEDSDQNNCGEQDKLTRSDSGVSDNTGSGGDTPEKERLYKDTTWLSRSETAV